MTIPSCTAGSGITLLTQQRLVRVSSSLMPRRRPVRLPLQRQLLAMHLRFLLLQQYQLTCMSLRVHVRKTFSPSLPCLLPMVFRLSRPRGS